MKEISKPSIHLHLN